MSWASFSSGRRYLRNWLLVPLMAAGSCNHLRPMRSVRIVMKLRFFTLLKLTGNTLSFNYAAGR